MSNGTRKFDSFHLHHLQLVTTIEDTHMPATTELILEQIKSLEEKITEMKTLGAPTMYLDAELTSLKRKLNSANDNLNESRILKG